MMEVDGTRERMSEEDLVDGVEDDVSSFGSSQVDWSCKYVVLPIHCIRAFCCGLVICHF